MYWSLYLSSKHICLSFKIYPSKVLSSLTQYFPNFKLLNVFDYDNIVVIFNNSSLFFNKYFPYTLKKYKRKFKNLKYVLLYTDILSSAVSADAKFLMDKNVFDLVYSIDDDDVKKYNLMKSSLDKYKSS